MKLAISILNKFLGLSLTIFCSLTVTQNLLATQSTPSAPLVFGVPAWETPEKMKLMHQPLMTLIEKKLNRKALLVITKDYADLENQINLHQIDVGFFPAVSYVKAKENIPGLKIIGSTMHKSATSDNSEFRNFYRGVIISLKSSGLDTLKKIENKKIGFIDMNSASGYKYPRQLLKNNGINVDQYFSEIFMLKKHHKVTQALVKGVIDVAATWDKNMIEATKIYGDIFNVIATTPNIPSDLVAVSPTMDKQTFNQLKTIFLNLKTSDPTMIAMRNAGFPYYGWSESNDGLYDPVRAMLNSHPLKNTNETKVLVGITPWTDRATLVNMYKPLIKILSQTSGKTFELSIAPNYGKLAALMKSGDIDFGIFAPIAYVQAKDLYPELKYLLTLNKKNKEGKTYSYYRGVIISLKESNLNSLLDLKNKRFAFTSRTSSSGYIYPLNMLNKANIIPRQYFSQVFMLKKHGKVIRALMNHSIDAGATWDGELEIAIKEFGEIFSIVAQTTPIPLDAVTASKFIDQQTINLFQQTLLTLKPELVAAMQQANWPYSGGIIKSDSFYDIARQVRDSDLRVE